MNETEKDGLSETLRLKGFILDKVTGFLENTDKNFFNPKDKTSFLKAFKTHGNQSKAAHDLGFPYKIIEWHLREDKAFYEAYRETLIEMKHNLEGKLFTKGLQGNSKDAKLWLETNFPEEYKPVAGKSLKKDNKKTIDDLYERLTNG